jgi:hypothetical protein
MASCGVKFNKTMSPASGTYLRAQLIYLDFVDGTFATRLATATTRSLGVTGFAMCVS